MQILFASRIYISCSMKLMFGSFFVIKMLNVSSRLARMLINSFFCIVHFVKTSFSFLSVPVSIIAMSIPSSSSSLLIFFVGFLGGK